MENLTSCVMILGEFDSIVCDDQVFRVLIIPVLETHQIFFVKRPERKMSLIVQCKDGWRIFNDQHKSGLTLVDKIMRQTFLIFDAEGVLSVCAELTVIRGVQKNEVACCGSMGVEKCFEVQLFDHRICEQAM